MSPSLQPIRNFLKAQAHHQVHRQAHEQAVQVVQTQRIHQVHRHEQKAVLLNQKASLMTIRQQVE